MISDDQPKYCGAPFGVGALFFTMFIALVFIGLLTGCGKAERGTRLSFLNDNGVCSVEITEYRSNARDRTRSYIMPCDPEFVEVTP